ncbi:YggS family pyridoxal phosphate-dependent enzyme [Marinobacter vulgaris]|uniref:Pyridoxal phosphate homeostasis protein n=1 Tax=Marinobacter vulgaris TaxID=1928331 RepID=A0A2V3ZEY3_9GAMM|nr:YggS family pyridoxal phosphate-dependent enzyme [Marinobacter vulgaris]PXX88950.1 YggS family pyridoxal phosphate-dependent enzyme [Marinobacter vulgaris]TSJ66974.1 YggS family pyridoxal phosphate-dependent enzyme [Marinobacter vulgaris]
MSSIADNIGTVTRRIQKATLKAGRKPDSVHLLAVSKKRAADDLRTAFAAGQRAFGESYVQEALDKMETLADLDTIEWHFIGPIQSNKTRQIANAFDWVHSVDRLKIAQRLDEQRDSALPPLNVCLQVNINNESTKSGCSLDDLTDLADAIEEMPNLSLRGLMAIPDPDQPEAELRSSFRKLANALKKLRQEAPASGPLDTLSMGMSDDLEMAVEEGSTWVRVGTALFGPR